MEKCKEVNGKLFKCDQVSLQFHRNRPATEKLSSCMQANRRGDSSQSHSLHKTAISLEGYLSGSVGHEVGLLCS